MVKLTVAIMQSQESPQVTTEKLIPLTILLMSFFEILFITPNRRVKWNGHKDSREVSGFRV